VTELLPIHISGCSSNCKPTGHHNHWCDLAVSCPSFRGLWG